MAAGSAVITTDSHGNQDFCIDGVNCIIVAQDDDQALSEAIFELLSNENRRREISAAAKETASKYMWSVLLNQYYDYFKPLLKGK
jgi:glycosyltransferase involved in cell wall biosynthesis